jgi:rod shape-determining protein MreC
MVMRTQREIQQRAPVLLGILLFANLLLMSFAAKNQTTQERLIRVWAQAVAAPFQRVTAGVGTAGVGFFQHLADLKYAAAENEELKRRLAETETKLAALRDAAAENERLKDLLRLKEETKYEMVAARVIARDPSAWFDSVIINRGSMSGIEKDMPVVTRDGIVGRIVNVSPWSAQVMLITDEKGAAGAIVGQLGASSAFGIIKGTGQSGLLDMRYVPGTETVNPGDQVLTTGQDRIYPPGLAVGEVVEVKPGSGTTTHDIKVRPKAHLDSLEEVAVLLYRPPQRAESDQPPPNKGKK